MSRKNLAKYSKRCWWTTGRLDDRPHAGVAHMRLIDECEGSNYDNKYNIYTSPFSSMPVQITVCERYRVFYSYRFSITIAIAMTNA